MRPADPALDRLKTEIAREFETPALVVDLDVLQRNIARVQHLCAEARVGNRPHIKTHKCVEIARLQRDGGAFGITCQKLGEAEVMADAGLDDILISYNLLGETRVGRLKRLNERAKVTVAADNPTVVDGLAAAGLGSRPLSVVVECDTGRKRAGVETPREAIGLARRIASTDELSFAGLLLYPLPDRVAEARRFFEEVQAGLREHGLSAAMVSTGGTPYLPHLGEIPGATEHRAGTYIFNDRMQMAAGVATLADCALSVYTTVVSRAGETRGILDAGSKVLTTDQGGLDGHGLILDYPEARIGGLAEEHGFLDLTRTNARPVVGEVVRVVPNHVCVTVNTQDRLIAVRDGRVVGEYKVAARGRVA